MILGAHVSIAGGVDRSIDNAIDIGCASFQIFTRNQRQWEPRPLLDEEVSRFKERMLSCDLGPVISHGSYLINLASSNEQVRERSIGALKDEIDRCQLLELDMLVMHPGSHLGEGVSSGNAKIVDGMDAALSHAERERGKLPLILLETTAGQGTNIGSDLEHLSGILEGSSYEDGVGICFDTCHSFSAGYDIRTRESYDRTMEEFDSIIGASKLKAFHLNDSKQELGSKKDRHRNIGEGMIGVEAFSFLMNDRKWRDTPGILETPGGPEAYRRDLSHLLSLTDPSS